MATTGTDLADGVRLAVEDLTARVSDYQGDTVGLSAERWHAFLRRLIGGGTADEGAQLGRRLIGYRELSFLLVLELAEARQVSPCEVMENLGLWSTTLDA
jgi:hypothetical protein